MYEIYVKIKSDQQLTLQDVEQGIYSLNNPQFEEFSKEFTGVKVSELDIFKIKSEIVRETINITSPNRRNYEKPKKKRVDSKNHLSA